MKCDVCGNIIIMDAGGKMASCVSCGMKHSIERVLEKQNKKDNKRSVISEKEKEEIQLIQKLLKENGYDEMNSSFGLEEAKEYAMNLLLSDVDAYAVKRGDFGIQSDDFIIFSEHHLKQMKELLMKYKKENCKTSVFMCLQEMLKLDDYWIAVAGMNQIIVEIGGIEQKKAVEILEELGTLLGNSLSLLDKNQKVIETYCHKTDNFGKNGSISLEKEAESISDEKDFVYSTDNEEEIEMNLIKEYVGKASAIVLPKTESMGKLYEAQPFFKYPEYVKKVIFNENVNFIGNGAFMGCTNLEEIHIPEHVIFLGYSLNPKDLGYSSVFSGCDKLKKVVFDADSLNGDIESRDGLFKGCISLKEVQLSNHMHSIDRSMFEGCTSLEEIALPDSVTVIAQNAFKGCTNLKRVVFSHPVAIHPSAFEGTGFNPPQMYVKKNKTNKCPVCDGKINMWGQCKKCRRFVHYPGGKKEWE